MRICLLSTQVFAWGKYGGFGQITRALARGLAAKGFEVTVVVPRRGTQERWEELDGFRVLGYKPCELLRGQRILAEVEADVFHSIEPHYLSFLAQIAHPRAGHVITCLDVRMWEEWRVEVSYWPAGRRRLWRLAYWFEYGTAVRRAVRRADVVGYQYPDQLSKIRAVFGRWKLDGLLPNPLYVPEQAPEKASQPLVAWVARLDGRKRPEVFLKLVEATPEIEFVAFGSSQDERIRSEFEKAAARLENLDWRGFVNQFENEEIFEKLGKAWVLVNTAAREGLPVSFLEAWAHGCAVLSCNDPGGLVRRFGRVVEDEDYLTGLEWLIEEERWRQLGRRGREWVAERYEAEKALTRHVQLYELALRRAKERFR